MVLVINKIFTSFRIFLDFLNFLERKYPTQTHSCKGVGGERAAYKRLSNFADVPFSWWLWYDRLLIWFHPHNTWRSPSTRGSRPLGRAPPSQRRGGGSHVCCRLHPPQVWTGLFVLEGWLKHTNFRSVRVQRFYIHDFKNVKVFGKINNNMRPVNNQ